MAKFQFQLSSRSTGIFAIINLTFSKQFCRDNQAPLEDQAPEGIKGQKGSRDRMAEMEIRVFQVE
jgi:hypothetical protein